MKRKYKYININHVGLGTKFHIYGRAYGMFMTAYEAAAIVPEAT